MDRKDAGEEDRDVQRRERRDALRGAGAGVPQELQALVEQKLLKSPHAGDRQIREGGGLGVDRSHRRQHEVAARPQQPVDRLRRRVEQAGPQVARKDERSRERHRDEREEQHVSRRQHMRGDSGAQHGVQQRRRILAEEQGSVQIGQLVVEVLGPQQRNDALEVAIGQVGQVEADQRAADGKAAGQAPALAADRLHRSHGRPQRVRPASGADHDVEHDKHRDQCEDQQQTPPRDVIGIAQRQARGVRDEHRGNERDEGHHRPGEQHLPRRRLRDEGRRRDLPALPTVAWLPRLVSVRCRSDVAFLDDAHEMRTLARTAAAPQVGGCARQPDLLATIHATAEPARPAIGLQRLYLSLKALIRSA
jgi:hypothetical protein